MIIDNSNYKININKIKGIYKCLNKQQYNTIHIHIIYYNNSKDAIMHFS